MPHIGQRDRQSVIPSRPMITVGCAGFPVPATRYFREFMFVEVQETHVALPGPGTIRRWRREAPEGFQFALLGPREVGQEGFPRRQGHRDGAEELSGVAEELEAKTAVFVAPPEFAPTRTNKAAVASSSAACARSSTAWSSSRRPAGIRTSATSSPPARTRSPRAIRCRTASPRRPVAYYRLHGPAGHKSRYEDPAIERLAEIAEGQAQGRDVRLHERRHVRRREALQEGDEALEMPAVLNASS